MTVATDAVQKLKVHRLETNLPVCGHKRNTDPRLTETMDSTVETESRKASVSSGSMPDDCNEQVLMAGETVSWTRSFFGGKFSEFSWFLVLCFGCFPFYVESLSLGPDHITKHDILSPKEKRYIAFAQAGHKIKLGPHDTAADLNVSLRLLTAQMIPFYTVN